MLRRVARGGVAVLITSVLSLAMGNPAAASTGSTITWLDVSKDHIVFSDSRIVTTAGSRVDGTCRWTIAQFRDGSDRSALGAQEIGRDAVNCIDVVRVGHVASYPSPAGGQSVGPASPPNAGGDPCNDEDFTWYDPLGIPVTEVRSYGCFAYTGQYVGDCTTSPSYLWWNSNTGWHTNGSSYYGLYYNSDDTQCFAWTSASFVHYAGTGCWSGTTYAWYEDNQFLMQGNGYEGNATTSWVTGACTNQLHWGSNLPPYHA